MHDCIKERASFPLGQDIFVNQNVRENCVQAVGMAVVWETLSKGTRFWGAAKTTFFVLFSYTRDGPWFCLSASEDQGSSISELARLLWGDILCASDSWVLLGDLCSLRRGRMAGLSKMCTHGKYLCVCVSTDTNKCTGVFMYIYACTSPFRLPGAHRLSERDSPHGRMSPGTNDFRAFQLSLIFTAGGENSWCGWTPCVSLLELNFGNTVVNQH